MKSKELLQAALDYLHKNITASIVYECDHDYSAGVKGAEVDYFPETADELLQEIGNEYADQFSEGDGWVKVEDADLKPNIQYALLFDKGVTHTGDWLPSRKHFHITGESLSRSSFYKPKAVFELPQPPKQ